MSTDRELLELAAKAAGLRIDKSETSGGGRGNTGFDMSGNAVLDWYSDQIWNPLRDDGDALRLAVNLNLDVCIHGCSVDVYSGDLDEEITEIVDHGESLESTRRAIVRSAAEIGRRMP